MEKLYDHRFQRTDQWMPVYSWLESLDTDEGLIVAKLPPPTRVHQAIQMKATESPQSTGNNSSTIPKGSEMYRAKQSEASRKYEILVELEKQLIPLFGKTP
ncbi:uncharacterized protein [Henckelia pumila]|uniref:uncharacterized protein isoform X2 n=1 Tax=Henckelia pumila TaxID=405737 RepID=UPI003C6E7983